MSSTTHFIHVYVPHPFLLHLPCTLSSSQYLPYTPHVQTNLRFSNFTTCDRDVFQTSHVTCDTDLFQTWPNVTQIYSKPHQMWHRFIPNLTKCAQIYSKPHQMWHRFIPNLACHMWHRFIPILTTCDTDLFQTSHVTCDTDLFQTWPNVTQIYCKPDHMWHRFDSKTHSLSVCLNITNPHHQF